MIISFKINHCIIFDSLNMAVNYSYINNSKIPLFNRIYYDCHITEKNTLKIINFRKDSTRQIDCYINPETSKIIGLDINIKSKVNNNCIIKLTEFIEDLNIQYDNISFLNIEGRGGFLCHDFHDFENLQVLSIDNINLQHLLPSLYSRSLNTKLGKCLYFPKTLKYLKLNSLFVDCMSLENLDKLQFLCLLDCSVVNIDCVLRLENVNTLHFIECYGDVSNFETYKNLKELCIIDSFRLKNIDINHNVENFSFGYDKYCSLEHDVRDFNFQSFGDIKNSEIILREEVYEKCVKNNINSDNIKLILY